MKKVYQAHPETFEFLYETAAAESPLEPGIFLIPAGAYEDPPPPAKDGCAIVRTATGWEYVEDHRMDVLYDANGVEHDFESVSSKYNGLGPIPEWLSVEPPQEEPETPTTEQIRAERDARIEAVRWRIERHNDELGLGLGPTEPLEPLLQYVQELRDVPQQEGFPTTINWPEIP